MLYDSLMTKAIAETVVIEDNQDEVYLLPNYRKILHDEGLTAENVSDFEGVRNEDIWEELKMFVEMVRERRNKGPKLTRFFAEVMEGGIQEEENVKQTQLVKDLKEYFAKKDEITEKEKELNKREGNVEKKEEAKGKLPGMINFAKR